MFLNRHSKAWAFNIFKAHRSKVCFINFMGNQLQRKADGSGQRKDPTLNKIIQALTEPEKMSPDDLRIWDTI